MKSIIEFIHFIEQYPVTGAAILSLAVAGIIGIIKGVANKIKDNSKYPYVKPFYFGLSKFFYITNVIEYFPDESPSGFKQYQYSRPDQWRQKVVKVTFLNLFHKIVPLNDKDILVINVRRNKKEKNIVFNRNL